MKSELHFMHRRAMFIIDQYGTVAMAFDTLKGPRTCAQGWNDSSQVLIPYICGGDMPRPWVAWYRNWNRPRFDFVNALVKNYEQQRG